MPAYLFAWNPHKWPWPEMEKDIETLRRTGHLREDWSCASHRSIRVGDRAFMVHVGEEPRGIIGSGTVVEGPFLGQKRHNAKKGSRPVHRVMIDFDVLLNPALEPILPVEILRLDEMRDQMWTPQSSGIRIQPQFEPTLEGLWKDFLESTEGIRHKWLNRE